jgi:SAM-dependent methyltransferase
MDEQMDWALLDKTISVVAEYYDGCKVGYQGFEGYRKSTDLAKLARCIAHLVAEGFLVTGRTTFIDLGCADGRVNVLMSYFVRQSVGIEINEEILAEFPSRLAKLKGRLTRAKLPAPADNIFLLRGDTLDGSTDKKILTATGLRFSDLDLFYTYITLHDLFADKIAREAKKGALYLIYGFSRILPRYDGLEILVPDLGGQGIVALYGKP